MKGDNAVEERHNEQQAAKTTMCGKAASGRRTNSQLAPLVTGRIYPVGHTEQQEDEY